MKLQIDYQLTGTGWAECHVRYGESECLLTASYLSDALGNLVLAAAGVLGGMPSVAVSFDEEPGENRWVIQIIPSGGGLKLRILQFKGTWQYLPDEQGRQLFAAVVPVREFGIAVRDAALRVLEAHGRDGYRQKWVDAEFPSRQLELLEAAIASWGE